MLSMLMAATAPGLALLSFFYLKDRFQTEPVLMVVKMFLFGAFLVFPIMVLQYTFQEALQPSMLFEAFLNSALWEEFFKWFTILFFIYHHIEFNEHYDGIVYSVAVSLGFATLENIFYLWIHGIDHAMMRAFLPVSSHALFGVVMGYYIGKAKFTVQHQMRLIFSSLFIPVLLHGSYNYILMIGQKNWLFYMTPFMFALWWYALTKVKKANHAPETSKS